MLNQRPEIGESTHIALEEAVRDAADGIFVIDRNRKVVFVSDAYEKITGVQSGQALGSSCACHELHDCKDLQGRRLDSVLCPALKILDGEIKTYRQRMSISRSNGERVWVETTYAPIRAGNGDVSGVVAIMRDINDAIEREQELIAAAKQGRPASGIDDGTASTDAPYADIPTRGGKIGELDGKLSRLEHAEILDALVGTRGQRTLAAQRLGISRSRLYRRMEALGIDPRQVGTREQT